jgi:hypothetical protein
MIEFHCPNEHKIRCPDDKAGRTAKCPKCGVSFRIPTLEELSVGTSSIAGASGIAEAIEAPAATPDGDGPVIGADASPDNERQIEFLCPNGHHLHGPATLQGRAGECPECGSRFRIPVIDEADEAPETLAEPQLADELEAPFVEEMAMGSPALLGTSSRGDAAEPLEFLQVFDGPGAAAGNRLAHPLAALFVELWAARDEGSRVEVHLESGSVLTPDGYLKSHSMQDHAVLVAKDPDGRSTVTIVPWNSIARIILRALKDVPGEVVR